jgi:hypothetical protein
MTKQMENRHAWQEEMKEALARLRAALSTGGGFNSSEIFDEFIQEHEWGLALHVLCDYLLQPTTQAASTAVIQQIRTLHEAMGIEDACVADLRVKAGQPVGD